MGAALEIAGLAKRYGGDHPALDGVSLQVAGGEFFTLLGPSGCGKTTLLRCVAGFVRPDAGRILCDGARLDTVAAHARVEEACRRALEEKRELADVLGDDPAVRAQLGRDGLARLMAPGGYLGAARVFVERALERARRKDGDGRE